LADLVFTQTERVEIVDGSRDKAAVQAKPCTHIRREYLDRMISLSEAHLKSILAAYAEYYSRSSTRLSLKMDSPLLRSIQTPDEGKIIAVSQG
jgi:hypothetical protein